MKRTLPVFISLALIFQLACNSESKSKPASSAAILEEIRFESHGVNLLGAIILPPEKDIVAAVVFVHGPGKEGRDEPLAKKFAKQGIAMLVYDKRGVGLSDGTYGDFSDEKQLKLLADDVNAAVELLSKHEKLKDKPIGLVGFSEAGWIIPLVATQSEKVKFMGLWSGPVAKLSEEAIFSQYTSDHDFKDVPTFKEIVAMRKRPYRWVEAELGKDLNSAESLKSLKIPGFWIFGANDGNIPVDISVSHLKELKNNGWKYEYVVFADKGHELMNETISTMTGWIKRINDPAGMAGWLKAVNDTAAVVSNKPINSDNLVKYTGSYISQSPQIMLTISEKDKKLIVTGSKNRAELKQLDDDSFYFNDYGDGYIFLDFDLEKERLLIVQAGEALSLDKKVH